LSLFVVLFVSVAAVAHVTVRWKMRMEDYIIYVSIQVNMCTCVHIYIYMYVNTYIYLQWNTKIYSIKTRININKIFNMLILKLICMFSHLKQLTKYIYVYIFIWNTQTYKYIYTYICIYIYVPETARDALAEAAKHIEAKSEMWKKNDRLEYVCIYICEY
jgi:hypothetical protein